MPQKWACCLLRVGFPQDGYRVLTLPQLDYAYSNDRYRLRHHFSWTECQNDGPFSIFLPDSSCLLLVKWHTIYTSLGTFYDAHHFLALSRLMWPLKYLQTFYPRGLAQHLPAIEL
jgi:hypothetical protein